MENYKTPLSEKIKELEREGYSGRFKIAGDRLVNLDTDSAYKASEVTLVDQFRFEGPSNPDDMSILYVIETSDAKKGVLVNAYGAYADREIDEFMTAVTATP